MNLGIERILFSIPAVIAGLSFHEFAHAFVALKLGDPTARDEGRVTLNPLKHLDPIGLLFIVVAGFGWAKPVHFNPANLKRKRLDRVLIAMAGPVANLVLGTVGMLVLKLLLAPLSASGNMVGYYALQALLWFAVVNFGLFVFNIIPLPPLDGSHVLLQGIKIAPELEAKIVRFGSLALFALLMIERRLAVDILPIGKVVNAIVELFI